MTPVGPVQPPKYVGSPQQMVAPVQPPKSVDSPLQLGAVFQIPKSVDSRSITYGSGSVVSDSGAALFDICRVDNKCSVGVKPSLFAINREKQRAKELLNSAAALQHLRPGMVLSNNFLKPEDQGHERSSECQKEGPYSSSLLVSSIKSPLQIVTPVQPPKSADLPLQMATPVQPPKSVDDSRSTSCGSGAVLSDSGAAPFDICRGVSKCSVGVKPSLLQINYEKRRARERSNSADALQHLRHGMVLLKNFLKPDDQVKIIKQCRELGVGTGGFYQPGYKDGTKVNRRMMCLGKKNWHPDPCSYEDIRSFDGAQPPKIPEELTKFVKDAIDASHVFLKQRGQGSHYNPKIEIPPMSPDICIFNFYTTAGKLGLHQDKSETVVSLAKKLPIVSFSLGDTGEFLYGDTRDESKASKIKLESGDVLIFGGQSRHIFHGVSSITEKTAPTYVKEANLRPGRLNLTFRQY